NKRVLLMLSYLFEFINVDLLEILGVSRQFTYYSLLFISSLVISLLIYFILYFCIKKRYDMVLFYVISSSCFFLLPYILSFDNVLFAIYYSELLYIVINKLENKSMDFFKSIKLFSWWPFHFS